MDLPHGTHGDERLQLFCSPPQMTMKSYSMSPVSVSIDVLFSVYEHESAQDSPSLGLSVVRVALHHLQFDLSLIAFGHFC